MGSVLCLRSYVCGEDVVLASRDSNKCAPGKVKFLKTDTASDEHAAARPMLLYAIVAMVSLVRACAKYDLYIWQTLQAREPC